MDPDGTVSVEFLVAFMPFLLLFLGGVQLVLLAQARIVVRHAAMQAVRAAVVRIDDDPVFYIDGERKVLAPRGHGDGSKLPRKLMRALAAEDGSSEEEGTVMVGTARRRGSGRMNAVRDAAYLPLSVLAPTPLQLRGWRKAALGRRAPRAHSLERALAQPMARVRFGFSQYARIATALTFPEQPAGRSLRDPDAPWPDRDPVHVRVTFLFPCAVPLARAIACESLRGMLEARERAPHGATAQALGELKQAEWSFDQAALFRLGDERFAILRAEASLPGQGAAYRYPSELCRTKRRAPGIACGGAP